MNFNATLKNLKKGLIVLKEELTAKILKGALQYDHGLLEYSIVISVIPPDISDEESESKSIDIINRE